MEKLVSSVKNSIKKFARNHYGFALFLSWLCYFRYRDDIELNTVIKNFVGDNLKSQKLCQVKIILYANRLTYQIKYYEYFLMNFKFLNDKGKREFVGDYERKSILSKIGTEKTRYIFDNKYETYLNFKSFYGRSIIKISSEDDRERFEEFVSNHKAFIVKPINKSFGKGVYLVKTDEESFIADNEFQRILGVGKCIVEECIVQCAETSQFHPNSVNTLRFVTFINNSNVLSLFALFRTGRGKSIVDNAGSGGVLANVDLATGIINTHGIDELGNTYIIHPDSGISFVGFQIPRWDEVLILTDTLARVIPEQKYVAWDLALTDVGWIVVEGNRRGQLGQQYAEKKGCRSLVKLLNQD